MDRFIVGTGRCGSTLLSRMLGESPQLASIFEFFNGLDMTRRFSREPAGGEEFAQLLSQGHPFVTMVLSRGYSVPEIVYPFGPESRFQREDDLPWLLVCALPRLSDDPDRLFREALDFARGLPERHLSEQYRALFDWLTHRVGRELWIERSGSSIDYVEPLKAFFPCARFLHIHRDGPEAALSMREHHAFRLAVSLTTWHLDERRRGLGELSNLDPRRRGEADDPISELLASRPDAEHFGRFWTDQLLRGFRGLRAVDAGDYAEVRFEDLLARPEVELRRICDFFELETGGGWLQRAAALIGGLPPTRADKLPEDERARLREACRPGMELVGRRAEP